MVGKVWHARLAATPLRPSLSRSCARPAAVSASIRAHGDGRRSGRVLPLGFAHACPWTLPKLLSLRQPWLASVWRRLEFWKIMGLDLSSAACSLAVINGLETNTSTFARQLIW